MKCPVCKTSQVNPVALEENLPAAMCEQCNGHWLSSKNYSRWLDKHGPTLPEKPFSEVSFEIKDAQQAKICPECGMILLKFKVGHGLDFFVDHCPGCGGVWLDTNEWNALKEKDLHDEIHRIFSITWQKGVREGKMKEKLDALYAARFGDDYAKARETREWIQSHPQKDALLVFLNDDDPYTI